MTAVVLLGRVLVHPTHEAGPGGEDSFGMAQQLLPGPGAQLDQWSRAPAEGMDAGAEIDLHFEP